MKLSSRILMAAIVFLIAALFVSQDAKSATHSPGSFVQFLMTSTDTDISDGSLDIQLAVRSATDMPVPGVTVVLGLCEFGQQVPFRLATRTRHLVPGQESLRAFNGGRNIEWKLASAPANTEPFRLLKLKLGLPLNAGGPSYCLSGWAWTPYDQGPSLLYKLDWSFGPK